MPEQPFKNCGDIKVKLFQLFSNVALLQTVTEKHKMNVPETMNEVLDMSDDEGKLFVSACSTRSSYNHFFLYSFIIVLYYFDALLLFIIYNYFLCS